MKKHFLILWAVTCLFVGCENENTLADKVVTGAATDITAKSVVLHGVVNVDDMQEFGMMIETSETALKNDGAKYPTEVLLRNDFEVQISGLKPNTKYYYCAYIVLNGTTHIGSIMNFETSASTDNQGNTDNPEDNKEDDNPEDNPEDNPTDDPKDDPKDDPEDEPSSNFTAKAFSISSTKQVYFSPGNLQYHPKNDKWRFAEHQWDYVGEDNIYISKTYNGWIDLFGWGTGNNPTNTSYNLSDYPTFIDWGLNKIGNDAPNTWRTLSNDEWWYLLLSRKNATSLFCTAKVEGKRGLVLLPDNWICPNDIAFDAGDCQYIEQTDVYYHKYEPELTYNQWAKLESTGAVFLPCAGLRIFKSDGTITRIEGNSPEGYYATSTPYTSPSGQSGMSKEIMFYRQALKKTHATAVRWGQSVRLVRDL